MCPPSIILRFAGVFVLLSVAVGVLVTPWALAFTAFVGFNMLQSSVTGFCPLERILGRFAVLGCTPRRR
jgi:Protein of unknown function (DUF2892)